MKTLTRRSDAPSTTSRTRLRQLCAVAAVVPALTLTACSGESPVTADPTAPTATSPASTSPATTSKASSTTTASEVPTTQQTAAVFSTKAIRAVIKDPALGHTITALKISRNLPFPTNQPVGAGAFEIVGVKIEFKAGDRYSADLQPSMLSLVTVNPKQTVAPTAEFGNAYRARPLQTAERGDTTRGWVFFKVDRGTTSALNLTYSRPAYQVSTTDKSIPAKTFTVVLSK